ncbi:hypothetical protein L249_1817 [Ophiocordyceps polyrhachis-furcata BCC 54312]|uniref:Lysophospholipase n=1 Tax=Ophiocordyceps polyrhachis-furcata BCC 54312 TaxID=1330021 RepID=A0A367LNY4_9HYPO|nr:hypothetical protein L249_1817 [Ophiocordyceps polyrhachis-furcata BCC 54312]
MKPLAVRAFALLLAAAGAIRAETSTPDQRDAAGLNLTAAAIALTEVQGLDSPAHDADISPRAAPDAPDGYRPAPIDCPSQRPSVRNGSRLSAQEMAWLPRRQQTKTPAIRDLLKRINIPGFDSDAYLRDGGASSAAMPNIGIAISGGGYRAMLTGAGVLSAFDDRTPGSKDKGNLGGLLQSATYLSALSGGSWLVGSMYANNFSTVQSMVDSDRIWQFDRSILKGPPHLSAVKYYKDIFGDVEDKKKGGFETSITDYFGRALSFQLINAPNGAPSYTFSSIQGDDRFKSAEVPVPIIVADGREPGQKVISQNSTIFEFNPWEMGSSDFSLSGYVPLKYTGSRFDNGMLPSNERCIGGYDNIGFILATSASVFNEAVGRLVNGTEKPKDIPGFAVSGLKKILNELGKKNNDIADWNPNPFKGWNSANNPGARNDSLMLVDGGEDLQNIPYQPLILADRHVDVIFSVDSSADTRNWPNGSAPLATYRRSLDRSLAPLAGFPSIPDTNTFINLGLNTRPTFFGCGSNGTRNDNNNNNSSSSSSGPLVVYLPNFPYVFESNVSTFSLSISDRQRDDLIQNGYALATQLNNTRDPNWSTCVGCAILARSFDRTRTPVPQRCRECFDRYCWNGAVNNSRPAPYNPAVLDPSAASSDNGKSSAAAASSFAPTAAALVAMSVLTMML